MVKLIRTQERKKKVKTTSREALSIVQGRSHCNSELIRPD